MADLLSTYRIAGAASRFSSSPRRQANQIPWHAAVAAAMYSASHEEVAATFCLCDFQLIGLLPRENSTPEVLSGVHVTGVVRVTVADKGLAVSTVIHASC